MVKWRCFLVGRGRGILRVDEHSTLAVNVVGLDTGEVVVRGEFVVVDDVFQHITTDLEGGDSGAARVVGDAMSAHCMACNRAASKAEPVTGIVLVADVVRAASKMGARDKTSEPSRRNSSVMVGSSDLVEFCSGGAKFGGNLIFHLCIFSDA